MEKFIKKWLQNDLKTKRRIVKIRRQNLYFYIKFLF